MRVLAGLMTCGAGGDTGGGAVGRVSDTGAWLLRGGVGGSVTAAAGAAGVLANGMGDGSGAGSFTSRERPKGENCKGGNP